MKNVTLTLLLTTMFALAGYAQVDRPVQQPLAKLVRFFPNPATSFIQFEMRNVRPATSFSLQIYNFLGKKVVDIPQMPPKSKIDLTNYTRGVYIYQVKDNVGKVVESGKFQVER